MWSVYCLPCNRIVAYVQAVSVVGIGDALNISVYGISYLHVVAYGAFRGHRSLISLPALHIPLVFEHTASLSHQLLPRNSYLKEACKLI